MKRLKAKEKQEAESLKAEERQEAKRLKAEEKWEAKSLKAEVERQQQELYKLKRVAPFYRVESNKGRGDCFTRAGAHAIYGDEKQHTRVQNDLCNKIEEDSELFRCFLVVGTTPAQYAKDMRRNGIWMDQSGCLDLALLTGCSVVVFDDTL